MKITGVHAVYPNYRHVPASWRTHFWQIVVQVDTDVGIAGYGFGGGGRASVEVVNHHFRELLLGTAISTVQHIEHCWDRLYAESIPYGRKGIAIMALSGIDLALYDALGKAEGVPVHELIGGARFDRVRAYATGPDTAWYAGLGFQDTKRPHRWTGDPAAYDELAGWAEDARRLLGPNGRLMVDTYMSWNAEVALRMGQHLEAYGMHWFEDVLLPDQTEGQRSLRGRLGHTLLAGGEHEFTHFGFQELARVGALDLWQPDITWCGGITAGRRIVRLAREEGIPVTPHRGGEVWGLHLIAATECEPFAEVVMGRRNAPRDRIWLGEPEPERGQLPIPDSPGFGVRLNEDALS